MELITEPDAGVRHQAAQSSVGPIVLPSRGAALDRLRLGLEAQRGPLLISGAAGVGKTWLARRLASRLPGDWRWARVDLSPATAPADCCAAIGHGLGLTGSDEPGASRRQVEDFLAESTADGLRWALVLDEAQAVSTTVLDEVRILANRLGQPDGFGGMILIGQTALARRLETRSLSALAARLTGRVHLRPLDIEEARQLVEHVAPGLTANTPRFESRHRDTAGNPQRLVEWARASSRPVVTDRPVTTDRPVRIAPAPAPAPKAVPTPAPTGWDAPLTGVSRPPVEVEDGVVEVGWDPSEPETAQVDRTGMSTPATEESVHDHYAALQAWNEWARNQDRGPARVAAVQEAAPPGRPSLDTTDPDDFGESAPLALDHAVVRLEGEHDFAPYSQLFSKLREANDAR